MQRRYTIREKLSGKPIEDMHADLIAKESEIAEIGDELARKEEALDIISKEAGKYRAELARAQETEETRKTPPVLAEYRDPWDFRTREKQELKDIFLKEPVTHRIGVERASDITKGMKITGDTQDANLAKEYLEKSYLARSLTDALMNAFWAKDGCVERIFENEEVEKDLSEPPPEDARVVGYAQMDPLITEPELDTDPKSHRYGRIKHYKMKYSAEKIVYVHPERVMHVFTLSDSTGAKGRSEVDVGYEIAISKKNLDWACGQLGVRYASPFFHIKKPGLTERERQEQEVVWANKDILSHFITDHTWELTEVSSGKSMGSLQELFRHATEQLCVTYKYPITLLIGESAGAVATASINLQNYQESIDNWRELIRPIIEREIDAYIDPSGTRDDFEYDLEFDPIITMTEMERREGNWNDATAFKNLVDAGLTPMRAMIFLGRIDSFIEDLEKYQDVLDDEESYLGEKEPEPEPQYPPDMPGILNPQYNEENAKEAVSQMSAQMGIDLAEAHGLKAGLSAAITRMGSEIAEHITSQKTPDQWKGIDLYWLHESDVSVNPFLKSMLSSLKANYALGYREGFKLLQRFKLSAKASFNYDLEYQTLEDYIIPFSLERSVRFKDQIKEAVLDGIEGGWSIPRIRQAVRTKAALLARHEAERIARTETQRAMNMGRCRAYKDHQIDMVDVTLGPSPCPECIELSMQMPMTTDEAMATYPVHPNCTCTVIPR